MAQIVPIQPVASQTLSVTLGNQACQINLYQKSVGLFADLYVSSSLIIAGVICHNQCRIVRSVYLGFVGDLMFTDFSGRNSDPYFAQLMSTYALLYLSPADLNALYLCDPPAPPARLNSYSTPFMS